MEKLVCTWRKPIRGELVDFDNWVYDIHAKPYEAQSWRMSAVAAEFPPHPTDDDTVDEPIIVER